MDAGVIALMIPIVALLSGAAVKIASIWANRSREPQGDLAARLQAVEADVDRLQQALVETQERLDFTERLLAQDPETRRLGSSPHQRGT
jgi:hypothetical protein